MVYEEGAFEKKLEIAKFKEDCGVWHRSTRYPCRMQLDRSRPNMIVEFEKDSIYWKVTLQGSTRKFGLIEFTSSVNTKSDFLETIQLIEGRLVDAWTQMQ